MRPRPQRRDRLARIVLALLAVTLSGAAAAQRYQMLGPFVVHYSALPTEALDPRIAAAHGIARAAHIGLLNIAVARKTSGGEALPVRARVSAQMADAAGRISEIPMREVRDSGAAYYVGEFAIRTRETLAFTVSVSPERSGPPHMLRFDQQFMVEE